MQFSIIVVPVELSSYSFTGDISVSNPQETKKQTGGQILFGLVARLTFSGSRFNAAPSYSIWRIGLALLLALPR